MNALRKHYEPIIASAENDYNEEFCMDTRIKIVNLTDVKVTKELWDKLKNEVSPKLFTGMQALQDKLTK